MPDVTDIAAATEHGRALMDLYAKLRQTRDGAERVQLLRRAGQSADALGARLQRLPADEGWDAAADTARKALGGLSEVLERVMVLEREYRVGAGAGDQTPMEG